MIYVLIIILNGGGDALTTQEFNTLEACKKAEVRIHDEKSWGRILVTHCVEKG